MNNKNILLIKICVFCASLTFNSLSLAVIDDNKKIKLKGTWLTKTTISVCPNKVLKAKIKYVDTNSNGILDKYIYTGDGFDKKSACVLVKEKQTYDIAFAKLKHFVTFKDYKTFIKEFFVRQMQKSGADIDDFSIIIDINKYSKKRISGKTTIEYKEIDIRVVNKFENIKSQ